MKRKLLLAALALVTSVGLMRAYQTPTADGIYYLYNTGVTDGGSGFISRGENYAQRAVINQYGLPIKLISTGTENTYYFQFVDNSLYLSDNGFMYTDGGNDRRRAIKVELQGDGIYKLINTDNNNTEVENWYGYPVGDGTGNRHDYLWQFLSVAEYEAVVADYTTTANMAIASSMSWTLSEQTTSAFDTYLSDNYIGVDKTSLIQHASFDTSHNTEGWTVTANANSSMSIGWGVESGDKYTPEVYQGYGTISQTVTVEDAGLYKVSVNAFVRNANGQTIVNEGGSSSVAYLQANNNKVRIADIYSIGGSSFPTGPNNANNNFFANGKYLNEVYVYVPEDAKTITITLNNPSATSGCWMVFNNFKLTYYSDQVSSEDATAILAEFAALDGQIMQASVQTALTNAKNTFAANQTIANYNALSDAISDASASKTAYANAKAYLDRIDGYLNGTTTYTNFYTSAAYNTYYADYKTAYDNRTMTTEVASELNADLAYQSGTAWHKVNNIDNIMLSTWKVGTTQCNEFDAALYVNTWSIEGNTDGSEFYAPFYEYWVSSGNTLAANTFTSTITGLKPSTTYTVTMRCRVQPTDGTTIIDDAIQMSVGEGDAVTISSGAKYSTTSYYIGNFSAVGTTDAEGNLVTTITVANASNVSWLSFYNVRYTEGEDLSAYIADYNFAKTTAQTNITNNPAVTGKEKVDLQAAINAAVDDTDKDDLIAKTEAINTANAAFVAAEWDYNTFAELNATVASTLGVTLPTITSTTVAADLGVESIIVDEYTAATTNYSEDYTDKLGAWTNAPGTNKGESWDGTTGDNADTYYDLYNSAERAMTQTVTLPAGNYALIAKGRASVNGLLTLTDGTETVTFPHKGSVGLGIATDGTATFADGVTYANNNAGRGWEYRVMTFTSDGETPITLTFNWRTASSNWAGLDDIVLLANPAVLDYSALQTAYNAVEIPTLGFEAGEYAPYTNAENLTKIAIAKSLLENQDATSQTTIDNAATAITNMAWTANEGSVEAVYNGNFAIGQGSPAADIQKYGWTRTNVWGQFVNDAYNSKTAYYNQLGSMQYGNAGIYTMPLKANTIYNLKFEYGYKDQDVIPAVSVLCDEDGMAAMTFEQATSAQNYKTSMVAVDMLFVTGKAGNYVLTIAGDKNLVITGVSITKAASQVLAIDGAAAMPNYAPGTYPMVTFTRTIPTNGDYSTLVLPFDMDEDEVKSKFGTDAKVYVVSAYDEAMGNITLEARDVINANEPVILKATAGTSYEFANKEMKAKDAEPKKVKVGDKVSMIGSYDASIYAPQNSYIVSGQNLYLVDVENAVTVKNTRAYITVTSSTQAKSRLSFSIDGDEATGIDAVESGNAADNGAIYNLSGQRVGKDYKGIVIKNGKKVMMR